MGAVPSDDQPARLVPYAELEAQVSLLNVVLKEDQQQLLRFLVDKRKERLWTSDTVVFGNDVLAKYHTRLRGDHANNYNEGDADRYRHRIEALRKRLATYYDDLRKKSFETRKTPPDTLKLTIGKRYRPEITSLQPAPALASDESANEGGSALYYGNSEKALRYVTARVGRATRIEDTAIRWIAAASVYSDAALREFTSALQESAAEFVSITGPVTDRAYVKALREAFSGEQSARVKCFRLRRTVPIMNFLILTFADDVPEVLFGYGAHEEESPDRTQVFKTTDSLLVEEFHRLFRALSRKRFAEPITVEDPTFVESDRQDCDVLATYRSFPIEQVAAKLLRCHRVALCALQWPTLDQLVPGLQKALRRECDVSIALWKPGDPFVKLRRKAFSQELPLASSIEGNEKILSALRGAGPGKLTVYHCNGWASVSLLWIDDLIYFGAYWRDDNASNGPHFLVHQSSHTGEHLLEQYYRMVPQAADPHGQGSAGTTRRTRRSRGAKKPR